ncbi:hypothetical protein Pint_01148 [Pistacia integerrima]|uniref:Uncharacterized protein n=1 Tax=Pistacia integerrima TaxID=434235 RepID=A0ACC0ZKR4_9ROSI|nr:hypothetical protein Pint_01148 [Pistacia integerrima]
MGVCWRCRSLGGLRSKKGLNMMLRCFD